MNTAILNGADGIKPLREEVEKYELKLIKNALSQSRTLEEAAHRLSISLSTLTRRLRIINGDRQR